jgi:WD40 repeat protein
MVRLETFNNFPVALGALLAMSPDGRFLAYETDSRQLMMFDNQTVESFALPSEMAYASSMVISSGPDYRLAAAVGEGYGNPEPPQLYIYSIVEQTLIQQLDNPVAFTASIAFNRNGSVIASTGDNIRLIEPGQPRWIVPTDGSSSGGISYRPVPANQAEQLAFGAGKGVILFDLGRGTRRFYAITSGSTGRFIQFSPDGQLMGVISGELHGDFDSGPPRFNLFDVETGDLLLDSGEYNGSFAFSPDGTLLVVSSSGGSTRILGVTD